MQKQFWSVMESYKSNSTKEREFETSLYQRYSEINRGIQLLLRNYWGKNGTSGKTTVVRQQFTTVYP